MCQGTNLYLLIQQVPVSIAMFDREMRYLAASDRWKEVHRRGMAGESPSADEDPFERSDGNTQWIKWDVQPWHNVDGSVGGILIATEEVTDRVLAKMALQESDHRKDRFLALLAHELRNPLASIRYAAQVFRPIGTDEPALGRAGSIIERQVEQLAHLVDDTVVCIENQHWKNPAP